MPMQTIQLGNSGISTSRLVYGCMRLAGDGSRAARERGHAALAAALDAGYTTFDHADIYGNGRSEGLFGEFLGKSTTLRDELTIVGKCGIVMAEGQHPKHYDSSARHIAAQVDRSLARLGIEHFDVLLLHRPDYLMDFEELAQTFDRLARAGKVRRFGVSNFRPSQVEALAQCTTDRLVAHQVEVNLVNPDALTDGTVDQCQRLALTPQGWSPLAGVAFEVDERRYPGSVADRVRRELRRQADRYGVDDAVVVLAWLLAHPAKITPIIGSTTPERIGAAVRALDVDYSRRDWYQLLEARTGSPVP